MSNQEAQRAIDEAAAEAKAAEPAWPRVVVLAHPIDFGSQHITQLEFRRGKLGDIKGMKLSGELPADNLSLIASRMCGQPVAALALLDVDDAGEVMALAMDFYQRCLTAGKTRSR